MGWNVARAILASLVCGLIAARLPLFQGACFVVSCVLALLLVEKVCECASNIRRRDVQSPP